MPKVFGSHPLVRTYLHFQTRTFWLIPIVNWAIRRIVYGGRSFFFSLFFHRLAYKALRQFLRDKCIAVFYARLCEINVQTTKLPCREIEKKWVACEWERKKNARNQSYKAFHITFNETVKFDTGHSGKKFFVMSKWYLLHGNGFVARNTGIRKIQLLATNWDDFFLTFF